MNTPDTEWGEVEKIVKHDVACSAYCDSDCNQDHTHFDENDCDCAVGKVVRLLSFRDTHWKEREKEVLKSIIRVAKDPDAVDRIASLRLRELLDLDNLK